MFPIRLSLWESSSTSLDSPDLAPFDNFKRMSIASFLRNYLHLTPYIGDFGGMSGPSCAYDIEFLNVLTSLKKKITIYLCLKILVFLRKTIFYIESHKFGLGFT